MLVRLSILVAIVVLGLVVLYRASGADGCPLYDCNGDGNVDIADAVLVLEHYGEEPPPGGEPNCPLFECSGDGVVDLTDAIVILGHFGESPGGTMTAVAVLSQTATFTPTATTVPTATPTATPTPSRDPLQQPFSHLSIWNMPIGSGAEYVDATLQCCDEYGVFLEEIYIFNTPGEALVPIYHNDDEWSGGSRCAAEGGVLYSAPIPAAFVIPGAAPGNTPNNPSAILSPSGLTYLQSQPLTHCTAGGAWTTAYQGATVSIFGDGIAGSQGGSHMSSIGGTIRVGEWATARTEGRFRHALKTVLDGSNYSDAVGPGCAIIGCRWPATSSDCGNTACGYTGSNDAVKMGTLLALPPSYDCATQMATEPGRILCQTFKDYGCYVVDGGWDPAYIPVEIGPAGDVRAEFATLFGHSLKTSSTTSSWANDWERIVEDAVVVNNNSATSIGGGGTPRVPLAPPVGP